VYVEFENLRYKKVRNYVADTPRWRASMEGLIVSPGQ
jgi:hypothetical protein